MKYNKIKSLQINDKENPEEIKYHKKEKYKSDISSKQYSNNEEGKNLDLNLFKNYNNFSSFKSRFFRLLSNDQNRTQAIRYLRNSFREKENHSKTMIENKNSENILTEKKNNFDKNNKIIKDYSPNFSNFDNKTEKKSKQLSTNAQYKNIPPLDFKKLNTFQDTNNQESASKNIPKKKLVICTNTFANKNISSLNKYDLDTLEHERNKSDRLYINKNDFHNYIKLGSFFVNTSYKKKKNSFDKGINYGNQTERLNKKNIFDTQNKKINSLIEQGRINIQRNKRVNSDLENYYDEYYYNNINSSTNRTANNFYPQKISESNLDNNINDYYLTQRARKSSSNIMSTQNRYIQPKQINFYSHTLLPANKNENRKYINNNTNTFNRANNIVNNENYEYALNTNNYNNINSNEIKSKIKKENNYINNKFNNKLFIKKRVKENKNIPTLQASSFDLAFNGNKNSKIVTKNGIYIMKVQKGQPIYEILINENNMNNINKFFVEEKIMVKDSFIELNLKNEISDIRQKYEQLKNELNQMKKNISFYQKKNDELVDIIQKLKDNQNKKDELGDEKNKIKEDKGLNVGTGYNMENVNNIEEKKENEIENNKKNRRKYKRREICEKNY